MRKETKQKILKTVTMIATLFLAVSTLALIFAVLWGRPQDGDGAFHFPIMIVINLTGVILGFRLSSAAVQAAKKTGLTAVLVNCGFITLSILFLWLTYSLGHNPIAGFMLLFFLVVQ